MKRSCLVLLIMLVSFLITAQPKPVITVLDFKTSGVSEREMRAVISLISNTLFKTGKFTVIDVAQRESLLKEIEFSMSGCVEETCQLEIGKQLSAEMIVVGSIDKVGNNLILTSKVLETQSARTVSVADGVYRDLDELVKNIGRLGSELAGTAAAPAAVIGEGPRALPVLVLVAARTFRMGSTSAENDEQPVHPVTIGHSFYISKYEVTQRQWREVMGSNPSSFKGDDLPVDSVSWYDAVEYCNRLSQREGLAPCYSGSGDSITCDFSAIGYRLPTEAEWMYAARGGNRSKGTTYAGSDSPGEVGWYGENSGDVTHPVGQKVPNELGLYDISGNVWEWCWDWYGDYNAAPATDPRGAGAGSNRVLRGGGWRQHAGTLKTTSRGRGAPTYGSYYLGFRPVRTAE
jgi:formylglycine-generating enzyme required for sulfatase activity